MEEQESKEAREETKVKRVGFSLNDLKGERNEEWVRQQEEDALKRKERERLREEARFLKGAGWKKNKVTTKDNLTISNETGGTATVAKPKVSLKEAVVTRKELRFRKAAAVINKLEELGETSQVRIFKAGIATQYQISEIGKDADGRIVITIDKLYETKNPERNLLPFADNTSAVEGAEDYFSIDYKEFCQRFNFIADSDVDVQSAQVDSLSHEFNIEKKGLVYNFERKEGKYD